MGRLEAKRAIITGGASGLGAAIAHRFAGEGAVVAVIDLPRMVERALAVVDELNGAGAEAYFVPGDVLDVDSIRGAIDQAAAEMGGVDLCIASAVSPRIRMLVSVACWTLILITSTSSTMSTCAASSSQRNALHNL